MFENLRAAVEYTAAVPDEAFGKYLLMQDRYFQYFSDEDRRMIIHESISCGEQQADEWDGDWFTHKDLLLKEWNVNWKLAGKDEFANPKQLNFAQYHDGEILISEEIVESLKTSFQNNSLADLLGKDLSIENIFLAHEIYHYLEDRKPNIRSAGLTVSVKIGFIGKKVFPECAGEIAAFAFSKKLNALSFNPCIFELIALWEYDIKHAQKMLTDLELCKGLNML